MTRIYSFQFMEYNSLPSMATFENENEGVRSRMQQVGDDPKKFPTNGLKLDDLRDLHELHGLDPIDQFGVAQSALRDSVVKVAKSETHKTFKQLLKIKKNDRKI